MPLVEQPLFANRCPSFFVVPIVCDFSIFRYSAHSIRCASTPRKTVILSEAPRRSIANRGFYGAKSKDLGDAYWQMLFGAFRPHATTEDKKAQAPSEAEGSAVPRTIAETGNTMLKQNWIHPREPLFRGRATLPLVIPPAPACRGTVSAPEFPASLHWTGPRVRLSLKERRMIFDNATNSYRKFGVAERRDLRFLLVLTNTPRVAAI